jgi:hypothetical protein
VTKPHGGAMADAEGLLFDMLAVWAVLLARGDGCCCGQTKGSNIEGS